MVEYLPSKQATWVRFPSPAFRDKEFRSGSASKETIHSTVDECLNALVGMAHSFAAVAQLVERVLGKDEVLGSNPSGSFSALARSRIRPSGTVGEQVSDGSERLRGPSLVVVSPSPAWLRGFLVVGWLPRVRDHANREPSEK